MCECNPEAMDATMHDLVNISDLNAMAILHNLRIRFKENKICELLIMFFVLSM